MAAMKASPGNKNAGSLRHKISNLWSSTYRWFFSTPERALADAYKAAEEIRNIEIEQFDGKKISSEYSKYTENVMGYWLSSLNNKLNIIKIRLAEFSITRSFLNTSNSQILDKLKFIDATIAKYYQEDEIIITNSPQAPITETLTSVQPLTLDSPINRSEIKKPVKIDSELEAMRVKPVNQKTGILPRSIGRTFNRIRADFLPDSEEKFVQNFRFTRKRTQTAVKFLAMLVLIPLLTQLLVKNFLFNPIVERVRGENSSQIFLNYAMEDKAFEELEIFEEGLRFQQFIQKSPTLSTEVIEQKVKEKALELAEEFRAKSSSAISNVFADLVSLGAFAIVIATSKREIVVVKAFIDDVVYGLSDSAKAFLIILFTDIFVGFHSPHGWEVILRGLAEHLGLPPSHSGIFLFIATFPVVLDTIFKYWIFRYLSRLSPSALATLKEMNE
jgi:CemA family